MKKEKRIEINRKQLSVFVKFCHEYGIYHYARFFYTNFDNVNKHHPYQWVGRIKILRDCLYSRVYNRDIRDYFDVSSAYDFSAQIREIEDYWLLEVVNNKLFSYHDRICAASLFNARHSSDLECTVSAENRYSLNRTNFIDINELKYKIRQGL